MSSQLCWKRKVSIPSALASATLLLPLIWVVLNAFKPTDHIVSANPLSLPSHVTLSNFTGLFHAAPVALMVSFVVTIFPQYAFYLKIGWINTFYPLTMPASLGMGGATVFIFLMRQFFLSVRPAFEAATALDGHHLCERSGR
jgi:ABC-type glycerol-3-phosphate transport system permease component